MLPVSTEKTEQRPLRHQVSDPSTEPRAAGLRVKWLESPSLQHIAASACRTWMTRGSTLLVCRESCLVFFLLLPLTLKPGFFPVILMPNVCLVSWLRICFFSAFLRHRVRKSLKATPAFAARLLLPLSSENVCLNFGADLNSSPLLEDRHVLHSCLAGLEDRGSPREADAHISGPWGPGYGHVGSSPGEAGAAGRA